MSWTSRRVGPGSERNGHADAHAHVRAPAALPPNAFQFHVQGVGVGTTGLKAEFAWGYGGSGPAQLALAVLLERGVPPKVDERLYRSFKWDCISQLPNAKLGLPISVVDRWIEENVRVQSGLATARRN